MTTMSTSKGTPLTDLKYVNKHYLKALESTGVGVDTVEKLCSMTMQELGKVRGIGGIGVAEIVRALREIGLKLKEA